MEGMTVGALKSSLGGGTGMTEISVTATPVLPERLSPWKVTKKFPARLLDGVQLKVPVLSPLSTKLAPAGIPLAESATWRDCVSAAVTVKCTFWFCSTVRWLGAVTDTFGCALKCISPVIGVVSASQNCSKVASRETQPLAP